MPEYTPPRFTYITAGDGFEVIGVTDGRPVAIRDDAQSANGTAVMLTNAAAEGPKALGKVLGRLRYRG